MSPRSTAQRTRPPAGTSIDPARLAEGGMCRTAVARRSPSALFADEVGGDHTRAQASLADVPASRYLQYRIALASDALPETPVVSSVNVVPSP
jgi:hypothetical protein